MFQQSFQPNEQGRDFVIGDLHGMYELLFAELDTVDFDYERDRCFSCGDLIDRGPDSEKCLSLIHEPWFYPVLGNHEEILIDVARNPLSSQRDSWIANGGQWHLTVSSERMLKYANDLDQQPLLIDVKLGSGQHIALCHAEYPWAQWNPEKVQGDPELTRALLWSRDKITRQDTSVIQGVDHIFCGHTIVDSHLTLGNTHFIDTGAFKTNCLTLFPLDNLQ